MKECFKNVFVFAALAILISGVNNCSGPSANSDTAKTATPAKNAGAAPSGTKRSSPRSSEYPALASSLAKAPFEIEDGSTFTVEDRKGKILLLNLWAVWCIPCKVEMPHLVAMQDKYRDDDFQVIGLNVGNDDLEPESFERMKNFAAEQKLNYEIARISNKTFDDFVKMARFGGVPLSILVDRDGHMRGVFKGGSRQEIQKMESAVASLIAE